jgi:hypothetical protein
VAQQHGSKPQRVCGDCSNGLLGGGRFDRTVNVVAIEAHVKAETAVADANFN